MYYTGSCLLFHSCSFMLQKLLDGIGDKKEILGDLRHLELECGNSRQERADRSIPSTPSTSTGVRLQEGPATQALVIRLGHQNSWIAEVLAGAASFSIWFLRGTFQGQTWRSKRSVVINSQKWFQKSSFAPWTWSCILTWALSTGLLQRQANNNWKRP